MRLMVLFLILAKIKLKQTMEKVNVTFQCNNNCKYCPINKEVSSKEPDLSYIKSSIKELKKRGENKIMLTGGEPLLRRDIFEIIKYAKEQDLEVELKTNGRLAFYEKRVRALSARGIDRVILAFPSSIPEVFNDITQVKDSYFQTISGIENLISLGLNLEINVVISKKNYKELKDIFSLLKRMGIKNIRLSYPELKGNTLKYSKEIVPDISEVSQYFKEVLEFSKNLNFEHIFIDNHFLPLLKKYKGFPIRYDDNLKLYEIETESDTFNEEEMQVYIQTNSTCNQKCVFCNRPPTEDYNSGQVVPLKDIKKKIDKLSKDYHIKRVIFTGGEPTLYPKLAEIIHYTKRYGFIVEIQTNGTLLNIDKLSDLKKAGLNIVNFAFHSHKKEISNKLRGVDFGFEKIINNLKIANKLGFEIHMIHVINSVNYKDLPEFVDYVNNMNLHNLYLNLSIVVPEGWAWENKWIIPRMKEIKPYLIEAMKRCKKYNFKFDVSEIVPLCIVNGFEDHAISTLFKLSNVRISDDYYTGSRILDFANPSSEYAAKAPQCKDCSFNKICAGFYPRLKELYGTDDFIPRYDDPLPLLKKIQGDNKIAELFKGKDLEVVQHEKERNPTRLYINLDEKCNENCVFCVIKGSNKGKFGSMSAKEAKKIIKEFVEYGGETLVFTGGEPTLRDDLPDIIEYAEQFDGLQSISIITNGVRLSDKGYLDRLINSDKKNKVSFCFSLHSHKKEISELLADTKNTFKKTISGIENVIKKRRNVSIYQVITSKNYKDLLRFSKFLNKNYSEIRDITFAYPFPQGNALLNKWIYVKLSPLKPYFLKALTFLEKKGYVINIAACGQFPLCVLPGFEEKIISSLTDSEENISGVVGEKAFHEFEMASEEWVNQYKGKTKECKKCILNKYCQGFWKEYIELFGFDGIQEVNKNNFKGNKIKTSLKSEKQVREITKRLIKNKMNLVVITDLIDNRLKELIKTIRDNKIFAVVLYKKNILYP
ncbi:MAG: radical SAM protein [Candidatus Nealsonbacteria bacterium]